MGVPTTIDNPEIVEWFNEQNQDRDNLQLATLFQIAASTLQLVAYYNLHDNAVDQRDAKIDDQIAFMTELNEYECGPDLEMLNCKKNVLADLQLPLVDMCSDSVKCKDEILADGKAVDNKSLDFINQSCGDIPDCWGTHDGNLYAAKAASYVGGITANSMRREQENFRQAKTDLVRAGQQGMKAVFNSNTVLAKYAQASSIHAGLADLFLQGFNSAGAGLGTALGQLGSNPGSAFSVGGNAGGVSTGLVGPSNGGLI